MSAFENDQSQLTERAGAVATSQKQANYQMFNPIFCLRHHCKWFCMLHIGGADNITEQLKDLQKVFNSDPPGYTEVREKLHIPICPSDRQL